MRNIWSIELRIVDPRGNVCRYTELKGEPARGIGPRLLITSATKLAKLLSRRMSDPQAWDMHEPNQLENSLRVIRGSAR